MLSSGRKILLGSGSPRRRILLSGLGFDFRVVVSKTDEIPEAHLMKGEIATALAVEKANDLFKELKPAEILLTADTIVWLNGSMLGKPKDEQQAFEMLRRLAGRSHQVFTGICLRDEKKQETICVESQVFFRELTDEKIWEYVNTFKPFDKAGAYGAQETLPEGSNPCSADEISFMEKNHLNNLFEETISNDGKKRIPIIDKIEGSYFNVMGLPVVELFKALEKF